MKSLKERLMFWRSGKAPAVSVPKFDFHNELLIEPGAYVSLDILDFKDRKPKVAAYQEWRREILGSTYRFTDYTFEDSDIKLRAFDDSAEKDDNVWLFTLFHEQAFDADLIGHLEFSSKQKEPFHVNEDDGSTSYFRRFNNAEQPHLAFTYPERGKYHYWDFFNEAHPEQLLYAEQNLNTGFIQLWLARRVPLENIFVV